MKLIKILLNLQMEMLIEKINIENMLYFLNNRKRSLNKTISINEHNPEWVNKYQDYILGKIIMCDAIICEIKRLMK